MAERQSIEEVLREHAPQVGPISGCWKCPPPCNATSTDRGDDNYPTGREARADEHRAHVADALRAAGYGLVEEAVQQGSAALRPHASLGPPAGRRHGACG